MHPAWSRKPWWIPVNLCLPRSSDACPASTVGSPLSGAISDRLVVRWRKFRGDLWVPEDRLRATVPGALVLVPMSILLCGLAMQFVPGQLGLMLTCCCFFLNGVGVRNRIMSDITISADIYTRSIS